MATSSTTPTQPLESVTQLLLDAGKREEGLANASIYLEAVGHVVIAWMWIEQLLAAGGKAGDFYEGKRQAARYFYNYELPTTTTQFELLKSLDRTTVEMRSSWF